MVVRKHDLLDFECDFLAETAAAYKVNIYMTSGPEPKKAVWLPKSQCEFYPEDNSVTMPQWLAEEKEIV